MRLVAMLPSWRWDERLQARRLLAGAAVAPATQQLERRPRCQRASSACQASPPILQEKSSQTESPAVVLRRECWPRAAFDLLACAYIRRKRHFHRPSNTTPSAARMLASDTMANTTSILAGGLDFLTTKIESMVDMRPAGPTVEAASNLRYYLAIFCVLLVVYLFRSKKSQMHPDIPFYRASKAKWIFDAETLVRDSYGQYHDRIYQIKATEGVQVLVPPKFIRELKGLPEEALSATEAVNDVRRIPSGGPLQHTDQVRRQC